MRYLDEAEYAIFDHVEESFFQCQYTDLIRTSAPDTSSKILYRVNRHGSNTNNF
jgi:hypothetical protein